MKASVDI